MKINLKLNQPYTYKKLSTILGYTYGTFRIKRKEILEHLKAYYKYNIDTTTMPHIITFLEQYQEYEKPNKKSDLRDADYKASIKKVLEKDNKQTAANIARLNENDILIKKYNHADSTRYEYTRVQLNNLVETNEYHISEKIWCELNNDTNEYMPMSAELVKEFYEMIDNKLNLVNKLSKELLGDYKAGRISKREVKNQLGNINIEAFLQARMEYKDKYKYFPIYVAVYERNAF